jgi:hypothetical protein
MVEQVAHRRKSWARVAGRFALALLLIIVSGSVTNAGYVGQLPVLISFLSIAALIWAVVGLVSAIRGRRARRD